MCGKYLGIRIVSTKAIFPLENFALLLENRYSAHLNRLLHLKEQNDENMKKVGGHMNIKLVTVGKLKETYLKQGIEEYVKRLGAYAKVDIAEVPDEKAPENLSEAEMVAVKEKEGGRILGKISPDAYVITLEVDGKMLTSEELAKKLDDLGTYGKSKIVFVIGGSLGLSDQVKKRSDFALSFSKMTFPHQLMRLVLLEQVYRAWKIVRGEPYHK